MVPCRPIPRAKKYWAFVKKARERRISLIDIPRAYRAVGLSRKKALALEICRIRNSFTPYTDREFNGSSKEKRQYILVTARKNIQRAYQDTN